MPSTVTLRLFGVWLAMGFAVGFGWAAGQLVALRLFHVVAP